MALFQPKPSINLSTDQEEGSASRRPLGISRKSSNWSIPCCSHISLGKTRGKIQLPDDSDNDSADEDYNQTPPAPFNTFSQDNQDENLPNVFLQAQARSQTSLSRNPFARVSSGDEEHNKPASREASSSEERQIDSFMPEVSGEEELASFTRSSFTKYDDELDWTESYKDDEDDNVSIKSTSKGFHINNNDEGYTDDDTKTYLSQDTLDTQATSTIPNEQKNDTISSIITSTDEEQEDRVPQIEEEVLHLLPLPELSNEIPPAMIHKKASFEKSMYGEAPLMSVRKNHGSRVSRFSMTEQDYLALKKAEEQEKKVASLDVTKAAIKPKEIIYDKPLDTLENNTVEQKDTTTSEATPKDDRRASIAQSILGDKLDDFTEKLAFIKKNIIMSIDSDEEDEEEISAEKILKKMEEVKSNSNAAATSDQKPPPTLHRRTSSLMDAVPTIARFMNQIGGGSNITPEASTSSTANLSSSQTSTSSFSPSSLFSALAGPMPEPSSSQTANKKSNEKRSIQEENEEEDDDEEEELFDFNKVIELGKNVKTFSEGFVGNGIRMFNDVATRMKTTVEEEQKRAAQIAAQRNESTSTASSTTNDNEWMHNYL